MLKGIPIELGGVRSYIIEKEDSDDPRSVEMMY